MAQKVLVVDDEPFMLRMIQIVLERDGLVFLKASNGHEAIEVAARERPGVVIMDAMMPKMDGLTALRLLKQDPVTRTIPVIMLTANPHKFSREDAETSGATVFLTKPFSPTRLVAEIRRLTASTEPAAQGS
jgi:two-component system chemotaxis response regulator CheY